MSASIIGAGWVTPLGSDINEVWQRLLRGDAAEVERLPCDPAAGPKSYQAIKVPPSALQKLPPHPRLRRASAISRFAALAGLNAIDEAKRAGIDLEADRTAIIFAISNGGVIYTRRFYQDIVTSGAAGASPILFPETVFNAPTSHLAALIGVSGQTYTLVGDGSVGLSALEMADRLLDEEEVEFCLVVGAEEVDWLLCDAYTRWRLTGGSSGRMVLSEGAGAVLLARDGPGKIRLERASAAVHFKERRCLTSQLEKLLRSLALPRDSLVIGSANQTFVDEAEAVAIAAVFPESLSYSPKFALGESVGASALWQTIAARQALLEQKLPPSPGSQSARAVQTKSAVLISCGLNQGLSVAQLVL